MCLAFGHSLRYLAAEIAAKDSEDIGNAVHEPILGLGGKEKAAGQNYCEYTYQNAIRPESRS